jgi:hypothetical protein
MWASCSRRETRTQMVAKLPIPESDLAVCIVGVGTHLHAVRLVDGVPEDRPICGSGRQTTMAQACWSDQGKGYEDAWEEDAVDCSKCLRLMAGPA